MKKVLILEDNRNTLCFLEKLTKEVDNNLMIYSFSNAKDACECMLNHKIDLFIVDIILNTNMPGDTSGLYFAKNVRMIERYQFVPLIFITSLEDSKCISYEEFHCYSFIEKPFDPHRVREIIKECLKFPRSVSKNETLYFRKDGIVLAVKQNDIIYVESVCHVLHIYTKNNDVMKIPYITLKQFLEKADASNFKQCRRNTVINSDYLKNVDIINKFVQLTNGTRLDIGGTFKNFVRDVLYDISDDLHN